MVTQQPSHHSEDAGGCYLPIMDDPDSDCESSSTLPDNPTSPTSHSENRMGTTTPLKRKLSSDHQDERQKVDKGANALDFLAFMANKGYLSHVCLALCEMVTMLIVLGQNHTYGRG
jgi:hypothetical protein